MKRLSKTLLALLLCITTATSHAQTSSGKPAIFANFPSSINISETILKNSFGHNKDQHVSILLGSGLNFSGTVISNVQKYQNLRILIIKSDIWPNTLMQVSQITNEDNSFSFGGRIISPDAADGYEIKRSQGGTYSLRKFETGRIFEPCSNQ
ncbi:MAG: hypothetical protein WAT19_16315 [Ferruginibacter sp.]